ncbi:MAG: hypothetical protein ACTSRH_12490 [Promethearchaeota archaeon]
MTKLELRCPICSKRGKIEVSEEKVRNTTRGLYAVNVADGIICDHSFVAYVDKNLVVRDTFTADFLVELPQQVSQVQVQAEIAIEKPEFDVNLIKMNFTGTLLAYILRAMIYKKKIVILSDENFLKKHLVNFFKYIFENSFEIDLHLVPKQDYSSKEFGDHFAFEGNKIIKDDQKLINPKKLNVEKTIVQAFLNEIEPTSSAILMKNEVNRIYNLSKTIMDYIKSLNQGKELFSKDVIKLIEEKHGLKIQMPYLEYLYEVIETYFGVDIPKSSDVSNFLGIL